MNRILPNKALECMPCCIVAVDSALCGKPGTPFSLVVREDGYATLADANAFIRANLRVKKRVNYKRGERPKLKDLHLDGRAVVLVLGHYLYLDHEDYWSFFDNENDDVVTVWILKEQEACL